MSVLGLPCQSHPQDCGEPIQPRPYGYGTHGQSALALGPNAVRTCSNTVHNTLLSPCENNSKSSENDGNNGCCCSDKGIYVCAL